MPRRNLTRQSSANRGAGVGKKNVVVLLDPSAKPADQHCYGQHVPPSEEIGGGFFFGMTSLSQDNASASFDSLFVSPLHSSSQQSY